jgi:serpin B
MKSIKMEKKKKEGSVMSKLLQLTIFGMLFFTLTCPTLNAKEKEKNEDMETCVSGNTSFALDLYARLKSTEGNIFFSPFSLSSALSMTYAGAREETADQMAEVMHFSLPQPQLHKTFSELSTDLNAPKEKGYELAVANRLWGQKGFSFLEDFLATTKKYYGAELAQVDFAKDTEGARKTINEWVEKQTKDKIKNLIPKGILNQFSRLVLTNAIYFKGKCADQFEKKLTKPAPFYVEKDKEIEATLMNRTGDYEYMENDSLQALELAYTGDELSMVVVLPKKKDGLAELESELTPKMIADCLGKLSGRKVSVFLPRFKTTSTFNLSEVLQAMGMKDAFDPNTADFSGMTGSKDLCIGAVLHKAFVDVNEEGTEAAAATAVTMDLTAAMPTKPVVFRADHPFLFLIRHKPSGSILFLGRILNPKK